MNKWLKGGFILLALILIGFLAVQAQGYFMSTYVGKDYYMQVPANQSTSIDEWQDGQYTIRGKQYTFSAYNVDGQPKVVAFSISANASWDETISEDELLQPNIYLKINASTNRVINWEVIQKTDVPEGALAAIEANR